MMLIRKRTRLNHKDQQMDHPKSDSTVSEPYFSSDNLRQKPKTNSFLKIPNLFVGFGPKNSESESVWSPTSTLDFRLFSSFGNPFRSPKSSVDGHQKSWDCDKVGLSIVDSLDDDTKQLGKVLESSESKGILFGPKMRNKAPNVGNSSDSFEAPKSLPKNYAISPTTQVKPSNLQKGNAKFPFGFQETSSKSELFGEFRSLSLDSNSRLTKLGNLGANPSVGDLCPENGGKNSETLSPKFMGTKLEPNPESIASSNAIFDTLSANDIELSEDYTCVKKRGANPKTTHIFGDRILECHDAVVTNFSKKEAKEIELPVVEEARCPGVPYFYPSDEFLSVCYSCKKKLEGEDIYMYRGEKAFCSWTCRLEEILRDEATENASTVNPKANNSEEHSETGMFFIS